MYSECHFRTGLGSDLPVVNCWQRRRGLYMEEAGARERKGGESPAVLAVQRLMGK